MWKTKNNIPMEQEIAFEKFIKYVLVYDDAVQQYSISDFFNFIKGDLH